MNVIFFMMSCITDISHRGIYSDLMRKIRDEGHTLYIVSPRERSSGVKAGLSEVDGVHILGVRTLKLQKANVFEKGLGQVLVDSQFKSAIKREIKDVHFDVILYVTPPITLSGAIKYLRRKNPWAKTYLLLKDIFPQNAVDIGMMSKTGLKGILYRHFRRKEKTLYRVSDHIGCMSPANVRYLLHHNPEIAAEKVEVAPNSIALHDAGEMDTSFRDSFRKKYHLPVDRPIFIYGGNLGKPQGIPFLISCLEANASRQDCHFLIIGSGTEFPKLNEWYLQARPESVSIMGALPKHEYDNLVRSCDVGLIFLDYRFTIPNYPSRLLSYMENRMPVLCATDPHTDVGSIAQENGYGYCCLSNSVEDFTRILDKMIHSDRQEMGEKAYSFLKTHYLVNHTYQAIMRHV